MEGYCYICGHDKFGVSNVTVCHDCLKDRISLKEALEMLFDRQKRGVGDEHTLQQSMDGLRALAKERK